jgi:hypothetical protein
MEDEWTMSLNDYQFDISTTNEVFGPGTDFIVRSWRGVGLPEIRTVNNENPFDHGASLSSEYFESRVFSADIAVRGDTVEAVMENVERLLKAWHMPAVEAEDVNDRAILRVKLPGYPTRRLYGRPRRLDVDLDMLVNARAEAPVQFFASDPLWYSDTEKVNTLFLGSSVAGRGFNKNFDYGWGGTATSGAFNVVNEGSMPTYPTFKINGPLTNIVLTNETTDRTLRMTIAVAAGDYLEVDTVAKTVMLNGTASRYAAKGGVWWPLVPGSNTVRFQAGSGSGTVELRYRDAWL